MADRIQYLSQSLAFSVAGLLVGFFLGVRVTLSIFTARGLITVTHTQRHKLRRLGYIALVLSVAALAAFTVVQGYIFNNRTERITSCQIAYSNGVADALDARSTATRESQEALDEWMAKVNQSLQPPASPAAADSIRAAFTEYLNKRAKAREAQASTPFPPAPRDVCPESK
jgi:hypothetical protein